MSAVLVAETEDFAQAAVGVQQRAAEPLSRALGALVGALEGAGSMAGSDPGGQAWSGSYDRAVHTALHAHVDAVNGCYRLAMLFAQSARNYERADLASSPSHADRGAVLAAMASVPGPTSLTFSPSVPSAAGGSGGGPPGWSLVQHAVGYMWPNGHQDRLRRAAAAWNASAAAIDDAAVEANLPSVAFALDRLPERDDVVTVCCGVASHLQDLAGVQRSLADACEQLAGHIDTVHSDVENELGSLTLQSGIVEGIGFLLSFPTAGAAELPTQGVEASRIAAVARRVAELIRAFIEAARALAATISGLADRAVQVTSKLKAILDLKVAAATVVMSRKYPLVGHVAERFAAARLALGFKGGVLVHLEDGKYFDPQVLEGMTVARVRASIPKTWERRPSSRGEGTVFVDPRSSKRQIRIMTGYAKGSRPDEITTGPYAVVSGGRGGKTKIPLAGNPDLK